MQIKQLAAIVAAVLCLANGSSAADSTGLMGWSEGADVVTVPVNVDRIDTISGIVYKQVKTQRAVRQLRMTVMIPRTEPRKAAVVYFPGGGFTSADHEKFIELRYALARAGFVVAACEYRTVLVKFPALLEDAKAAVRFLRANAREYGIDPERIGAVGDSAGGYLVNMLGATNGEAQWNTGENTHVSGDVQAVASFYGISDLASIGEGLGQDAVHASPAVTEALLVNGPAFGSFAGAPIAADAAKARQASPLGHVDGNEPPFLILHGARDRLVSPLQSKRLYEALKNRDTDVEYVLVQNAAHGDLLWMQEPIVSRVVRFFKTRLGAKPVEAAGTK